MTSLMAVATSGGSDIAASPQPTIGDSPECQVRRGTAATPTMAVAIGEGKTLAVALMKELNEGWHFVLNLEKLLIDVRYVLLFELFLFSLLIANS